MVLNPQKGTPNFGKPPNGCSGLLLLRFGVVGGVVIKEDTGSLECSSCYPYILDVSSGCPPLLGGGKPKTETTNLGHLKPPGSPKPYEALRDPEL